MNDTIAAISTALGVGAISIIRVSGKEAISIVNKVFEKKDLEKVDSHTIHYGHIVDKNEVIDEVLVSVMRGPKTFTAEDVVEINCHGGIASTKKILEVLLLNGCRLAEPGEFTRRAFVNGRIDLVKAESVMNVIKSENDNARRVAMKGLDGFVSEKIRMLRKKMLELLASIEVNIDYPEYEDIEVMTNEKVLPELIEIKKELKDLVEKSENGQVLTSGIKTAIVGRPNVGKSSILNRMLKEDKAIVTNIEGTTRDTVEGKVNIGGVTLDIIDTAGIRETKDIVEQIGVEKSLKLIDEASLILIVLNNNEPLTKEDEEIIERAKGKNVIYVINKSDLETKIDLEKLEKETIVFTNTLDVDGISSLEEKIKEKLNLDEITSGDFTYLSGTRQISLAKEALQILEAVITSCQELTPLDMVEMDIKVSWEKLGEIIGESYSEELIDQLFSQFCLGK